MGKTLHCNIRKSDKSVLEQNTGESTLKKVTKAVFDTSNDVAPAYKNKEPELKNHDQPKKKYSTATATRKAPTRGFSTMAATLPSIQHAEHEEHEEHEEEEDDGHHDSHGDFLEKQEVESRIIQVLSKIPKINQSALNGKATFRSLGLDHLDEVEIIMQLEEEFVIDLHDPVAGEITSIPQAVEIISNFPYAK